MRKLVFIALSLLLILILSIAGVLFASLPPADGTIDVDGLDHRVEIRYDAYARPFVSAQNLTDAFVAQGWLHAAHRLWQMELFRRAARGKLAELLGPSMLAADEQLWRYGVPQLGQRFKANRDQLTASAIAAYVRGVNAYLDRIFVPPPEFILLGDRPEPWTDEDVYAVGALLAFQSANNATNELVRLGLLAQLPDELAAIFMTADGDTPDYPFVLPNTAEPDAVSATLSRLEATNPLENLIFPRLAFGSNGWVVGPEKSASGKALFAFDSHDALGLPNLFYEVHLFFGHDGAERQIRGWSVAGLPGVINGFNENIAWGFTNIGDTQDLFTETPHPTDPDTFLDGDQWYQAETSEVTLAVRGAASSRLKLTTTRNGSLISENPPIALRWTIQDVGERGLGGILSLNLAQNWNDFNRALDAHAAPSLNATYADVEGNIGFRTTGLLPIRGAGMGIYPLAGDRPGNRWRGTVPTDQMPRRFNPEASFLAAANARVQAAGAKALVSADNAAPYRMQRIQSVLSQQRLLTPDDMIALQNDWYDSQAEALLAPMLADLPEFEGLTPRTAVLLLDDWLANPVAAPHLAAPLIFQRWYQELARAVFSSQLDEGMTDRLMKRNYVVNHALDRLIREPDHLWWQSRRAEFMEESFKRALRELSAQVGPDPRYWRLDRVHPVKLRHELGKAIPQLDSLFNVPAVGYGGSTSTVGRASYRYADNMSVTAGATVRVVAEMSRPIKVSAVIPGGQSGHPVSAHYSDQLRAWVDGEVLPLAAAPDQAGDVVVILQGH